MSRMKHFLVAVPALLVGGLVVPQTTSYADVGSRHGYWPASDNVVAQAEPMPPRPRHRVPRPPRCAGDAVRRGDVAHRR